MISWLLRAGLRVIKQGTRQFIDTLVSAIITSLVALLLISVGVVAADTTTDVELLKELVDLVTHIDELVMKISDELTTIAVELE